MKEERKIGKIIPKLIDEIKLVRTIEKGRKGTLDAYTLTSKAKIEGVYEFISDLLDIDIIKCRFIKCEYQILICYVTHKIVLRTKTHYLYKTIRTVPDT